MTKENSITQINQTQADLLDYESIFYYSTPVDIKISDLVRSNYSNRLLVENQKNSLVTSLTRFCLLGGIFIESQSFLPLVVPASHEFWSGASEE